MDRACQLGIKPTDSSFGVEHRAFGLFSFGQQVSARSGQGNPARFAIKKAHGIGLFQCFDMAIYCCVIDFQSLRRTAKRACANWPMGWNPAAYRSSWVSPPIRSNS